MNKQTLSNYGWIVVSICIIAVMLALASPFGSFVADAVKSTTAGFIDVNNNANIFLESMSVKIYTTDEVVDLFSKVEPLENVQGNRADFSDASSWNDYVNKNFATQKEAIKAYESLSDENKQAVKDTIGEDVLDKLMQTELETKFNAVSFTVTKGTGEYQFQATFASNRAYEIGTHISYGESGGHPMTVVVVDTNKITGAWAPSGLYELGQSEYDVLYCCESDKPVKSKTFYKKINLEDSDYFGDYEATMIRAIVQNSYPYISLEQMKSDLQRAGFPNADKLTRGDIITAVQFAIWRYSNAEYKHVDGIDRYGETTNNTQLSYAKAYHDYTNELWHWWSSGRNATYYDATAEQTINSLVDYLCSRQPVYATGNNSKIISEIDLTDISYVEKQDGTYDVSLVATLNSTVSDRDNVTITAKNANGIINETVAEAGKNSYAIHFNTNDLNNIEVYASGTQDLDTSVYLYMPQTGKENSQVLVGMSDGITNIKATSTFTINN